MNKFLLARDKFIPEIHSVQFGFTYSGPFTKKHVNHLLRRTKEYKISKKQDIHDIFNKMNQVTVDLNVTQVTEILKLYPEEQILIKNYTDKTINIAKNTKYDGYQRGLISIVYQFFDKKPSGSVVKNENMSSQELAEELHKAIIRKVGKRKTYYFLQEMFEALLLLISNC